MHVRNEFALPSTSKIIIRLIINTNTFIFRQLHLHLPRHHHRRQLSSATTRQPTAQQHPTTLPRAHPFPLQHHPLRPQQQPTSTTTTAAEASGHHQPTVLVINIIFKLTMAASIERHHTHHQAHAYSSPSLSIFIRPSASTANLFIFVLFVLPAISSIFITNNKPRHQEQHRSNTMIIIQPSPSPSPSSSSLASSPLPTRHHNLIFISIVYAITDQTQRRQHRPTLAIWSPTSFGQPTLQPCSSRQKGRKEGGGNKREKKKRKRGGGGA